MNRITRIFKERAIADPELKWYAIADSAQRRDLPHALLHSAATVRCLLGVNQNTPLAEQSPHLVQLTDPLAVNSAWQWIGANADNGSIMVIASAMAFDDVFKRLSNFIEIQLPDGAGLFLAYWDPAIFGTLVGQADDSTLHVSGPVFNNLQAANFFDAIESWWYWDRTGVLHECDIPHNAFDHITFPLQLTQFQVDDLVEASVPDHVIYFLKLNQPILLAKVLNSDQYKFVSQKIIEARGIGLEGMRDIVNYVCAALVYNDRLLTDPQLRDILLSVRRGEINFTQALARFP